MRWEKSNLPTTVFLTGLGGKKNRILYLHDGQFMVGCLFIVIHHRESKSKEQIPKPTGRHSLRTSEDCTTNRNALKVEETSEFRIEKASRGGRYKKAIGIPHWLSGDRTLKDGSRSTVLL